MKEQEQQIESLEIQELKLMAQKNMLKSLLIEPLRDFHNKVKDEVEDEFVNIRQVAPGPDTQIFEIQQNELLATLKSKTAKRGKSESAAKILDKNYDPNAVKEWGDKVS